MSHAAFSSGRGRHVPIKNQVFLAACTQGQEDTSDLKKKKANSERVWMQWFLLFIYFKFVINYIFLF